MSLVNGGGRTGGDGGVEGGASGGADVWGRGTKRAADESNLNLNDWERFEKRLRMLSLREENKNGRRNLYTPVSNAAGASTRHGDIPKTSTNHVKSPDPNEHMHVDDRPDRVYIHDLDAELASDSDSDSERLIFLPDIEKRFSKIPHQLLRSSGDESQELVLYSVPKSLSMDEGHDSVRKAILETRARAREKAVEDAKLRQEAMERQYDQSDAVDAVESAHGYSNGYVSSGQVQDVDGQESDAMDLD